MKKIIIFALTAMIMTGCTLDRDPETALADSNFWKSETDFRGACNRLYIDLNGFSHDLRSDELVGPNQNSISSGNRNVPGTSGDWTNPYQDIFRCNKIIEKGAVSPLSESARDRWVAEARFFRAYHYFDLVQKYGDVPLITKTFDNTKDPEITKGRDPRAQVIDQCYEDLDFAAAHLPDINNLKSASDWGRVSRSAALGMLVRIGLYEGTYMKYHHLDGDYKIHLQRAISAAETMMKEGRHALYPDFQKLFLWEGEGSGNKEAVFIKVYGPNGEGTITHNNSRGLENAAALTRNMLDNFLYADGLPRELSPLAVHPETNLASVLDNRDPRLKMTVYSVGEEAYKGPYEPFTNQHGYGYGIKKGFLLDEWSTNNRETLDKMIIRYAEILLSYAEAKYELDGAISDAVLDQTVNAVRQRSGFNVRLTNDFVNQHGLNMLQEIRRERMVEFIDEGLHYNDIIRWKTAEKVLPQPILGLIYSPDDTGTAATEVQKKLTAADGTYKGTKVYDEGNIYVIEEGSSRSFDPERDYLYPIPSYEIGTSGGNIVQNPNW